MKHKLALAVALLSPTLGTPVLAASPADQFRQAHAIFYAGKATPEDYRVGYVDVLLDGADGLWLPLYPAFIKDDIESHLKNVCPRVGLRLVRTSDDAFTMTWTMKDKPLVHTYVAMGGNTFSVQVDPDQLVAYLLDNADGLEDLKVTQLSQRNGIATIVRPSPDVLVAQINNLVPVIFTRCPEPG